MINPELFPLAEELHYARRFFKFEISLLTRLKRDEQAVVFSAEAAIKHDLPLGEKVPRRAHYRCEARWQRELLLNPHLAQGYCFSEQDSLRRTTRRYELTSAGVVYEGRGTATVLSPGVVRDQQICADWLSSLFFLRQRPEQNPVQNTMCIEVFAGHRMRSQNFVVKKEADKTVLTPQGRGPQLTLDVRGILQAIRYQMPILGYLELTKSD